MEIKKNKLVFILNEDQTAGVISNDDASENVTIPKSVEYEDQEFKVTSILKYSFKNSKTIKSIYMPQDSELQTIEKESFAYSTIERLLIPSKVTELKNGWCSHTPNLTKIQIHPTNERYIYVDEKLIFGKSDPKSDEYDEIIFARRDIKKVLIPSFIKTIRSYAFSESIIESIFIPSTITKICEGAFYRCENLKKVEFEKKSKKLIIEKLAFSETSIESISFTSASLELNEGWNYNSPKMKKINFLNEEAEEERCKLKHEKAILDNLQCPVCYLAMLPPLRTPMLIPKCGHSICESCIAKLTECPICHQKIKNPLKNLLALEIIESIDKNEIIPDDFNPKPPPENKLIPKIEPICTFAVTGKNYTKGKFYHCKTCNIIKNKSICEICAKKCHIGHDIHEDTNINDSFCDCHFLCKCQCLPEINDLRCTFELTYGIPVEQPMYKCMDCHLQKDFFICQNCAIKCHQGHTLEYVGIKKEKICHCFDQCDCQISMRKPICTYTKTGPNYISQPFYHCKTCDLVNEYGCCSACANHCHKGHEVEFYCFSDEFYCDCIEYHHCQLSNNYNSSYLTSCPNFLFKQKDKKIKQRKYHCLTCGITESLGICEGCAINCHINHAIQFVGVEEFSCSCQTTDNCIMMFNPLLHDDRERCDREVLQKDDISACYTCYTCDESGKINICETCALKNHLDHDIHLLGYMKFDCHG